MKLESAVYAVAGMCFGIILGWVMARSRPVRARRRPRRRRRRRRPRRPQTRSGSAPALDEAKVQSLTTILKSDPNNASATLQLANAYFDAERFTDAI